MRKPDFFIIGAPKAGTTALSEYLRDHPRIFFSDPKEPHYFNEDFRNRHTTDLETYLSYFDEASSKHEAVGEGSVFYLSSEVAVNRILAFQPRARFIVMLRNPVEMAYSWHSQALHSFGEEEGSFEAAWRLQDARREGRSVPALCPEAKTLVYGDLCRVGVQLQRLYERVPRDRVHLILFEDFANDTRSVYREVLTFLNLPDDGRRWFERANPNKAYRSLALERLSRKTMPWIDRGKARLGIERNFGLLRYAKKLNTVIRRRPLMSRGFRAELKEYFRRDVALLEDLSGLDLSRWS